MKKYIWLMCAFGLALQPVAAHQQFQPQVEVVAKTTKSWDGDNLPAYPEGQPEITILRIIIPPKVQLPLHYHPVINAGVLLKGQLTVITKDKKRLDLKAGDSIVELVNKWHYGRNEGDDPAEIIVFYAGTVDEKITVIGDKK
ncbi:cupin domain-containing protein [Vibrio europaeus]|uniref:Cupin domain-containing protein n=2 Tax=Vibrio europaeus TaxID=300876 RepID=A0AAE7AYK3_9VIBR|nr:cupin domain-containing protein [Vibrio europaeus]QPG34217.1 cupin domain-containing protein [Vibrio europaeus]